MNAFEILDCTLRDGGYVNKWVFGYDNINKAIKLLVDANIDIIECGFLTNRVTFNANCTLFDSIERIRAFIPDNRKKSKFVCMINYGEYDLKDIPSFDGTSVDGIRVAFHKKDMVQAMQYCSSIKKLGYELFIQPMVSVSYNDIEFIELINCANDIDPYALYIVDSFGVMKQNDLLRFFCLIDHNLNSGIRIGYHSHNNIQMAYSNAQTLVDMKTTRKMIVDSSVFGMGRGAGNLNTELFIEYLNDSNGGNYKSKPLLQIIDDILNKIYAANYWGYSLPHYLSAKHNCHPNYATFLSDKNTLTVEDIDNILGELDSAKLSDYDNIYIEQKYFEYQSHKIDDRIAKSRLKSRFENNTVIMVGPGNSILTSIDLIKQIAEEQDGLIIAVNFKPDHLSCDYIFVSNNRRFEELNELKNPLMDTMILTSNIQQKCHDPMTCFIVNYIDLINEEAFVKDNAGLMLIKLLTTIGVKKILIAGFDGYSYENIRNYADPSMVLIQKNNTIDLLNQGMKKMIDEYSHIIPIEFVNKSKYQES